MSGHLIDVKAEAHHREAAVAEAFEFCRRLTKERARNFYYAFITLPRDKRYAIYSSYAFCRYSDDYTDENLPLEEKIARLTEHRQKLDQCFQGHPPDPVFVALRETARRHSIPKTYFEELLSGVEMDLTIRRYETFEDLLKYCYKVASIVGLICIEIFGYSDAKAKEHAVDLGVAMQLTNILRDLKEDARRDRIYLPLEELRRFDYTEEELMQGVVNENFRRLMRFQVQRARDYFVAGQRLLPLLAPRSRACVAVLHGLYNRVLDKIEARHYDVFSAPVSLSTPQKLLLTGKLWTQSLLKNLIPAPSS